MWVDISTVDDVQYCGGIPSVHWRMFSTIEKPLKVYFSFSATVLRAFTFIGFNVTNPQAVRYFDNTQEHLFMNMVFN